MDNSIKNNGNISPSSPRLPAVGPEVAPTTSNVQQVNSASPQITQAMRNAQAILSAVQSPEDKALMEIILDTNTNPDSLISTAVFIKDRTTQQKAWVIIASNSDKPIDVRFDAAFRIRNEKVRDSILLALTEDPELEKYFLDPAKDCMAKSSLACDIGLYNIAMQQKAYWILATNPQTEKGTSISCAKQITDLDQKQKAFVLLAQLPPKDGDISEQVQAFNEITDPEQKQILCSYLLNHTTCCNANVYDLFQVLNCLSHPSTKEECAIKILQNISNWYSEEYNMYIGDNIDFFKKLYDCITPENQELILSSIIKNIQLPIEFRASLIREFIDPDNQAALLDGIENGFKRAKSSRNV